MINDDVHPYILCNICLCDAYWYITTTDLFSLLSLRRQQFCLKVAEKQICLYVVKWETEKSCTGILVGNHNFCGRV